MPDSNIDLAYSSDGMIQAGHRAFTPENGEVFRAQNVAEDKAQRSVPRHRVYSAEFGLSCSDPDKAIERFMAAVQQHQGYLETQENNTIVCRIPAAQFQQLVDRIEDFGTVDQLSIKSQDVTDAYTDFSLRLNVTEASRRRLMALMERTASLTELLKLEEELAKQTTTIESLKGKLKQLKQQIEYSKIRIVFSSKLNLIYTKSSPFQWINQLGTNQVRNGFSAGDPAEKHTKQGFFSNKTPMETPRGFIAAGSGKHELQALTPDDARLWMREFSVHEDGDLEFWTKAITTHFVDNRGYKLLDSSMVSARETKHFGHQLLFESFTDQRPAYYLITYSLFDRGFLKSDYKIQVVEFVATPEQFAAYVESVGEVSRFGIACRASDSKPPELLSQND